MALQRTIGLTSVTESISSFSFTLSRSAEAVTLVIFVQGLTHSNFGWVTNVLIKDIHGFALSFLANAEIIRKLDHDHFLPHSNSLFIKSSYYCALCRLRWRR